MVRFWGIGGLIGESTPENHGAGAFYGVEPVTMGHEIPGQQGHHPYELQIGDTYQLTVEVRGLVIRTFLRSVRYQTERVLVSRFQNVSREDDPIRGGLPIGLLLQAFPNNGSDVKSPVFHRIELQQ